MRVPFVIVLLVVVLDAFAALGVVLGYDWSLLAAVFGTFLLFSARLCNQWEKAIVLRLGKYHATRSPGIFFLIPGVDTVFDYVDSRIQSKNAKAEKALTRDGVSVDVDAVVFWQIFDAEKASLEIKDYDEATDRVAQTSLREMIGACDLSALLSEREKADADLGRAIDEKTRDWG